MYRRYRYFIYFLGALVLGSFLLDWLSNRVPTGPRAWYAPTVVSPRAGIAAPPAPPADTFGPAPPPYAPSYENSADRDREAPKARETSSSDQTTPPGISNSSDLQPAGPPTASSEAPDAPDRDQTTTSPKSSNAALREIIKPKGR